MSEFDFDTAFKSYFGKSRTPGITGIGFGVDTSKAGKGGAAGAFIKRIEFISAVPGSSNAGATTFAATDTLARGPLVTTMAYTWGAAGR